MSVVLFDICHLCTPIWARCMMLTILAPTKPLCLLTFESMTSWHRGFVSDSMDADAAEMPRQTVSLCLRQPETPESRLVDIVATEYRKTHPGAKADGKQEFYQRVLRDLAEGPEFVPDWISYLYRPQDKAQRDKAEAFLCGCRRAVAALSSPATTCPH